MNFKKFISENIIELGDHDDHVATKVAPKTTAPQQSQPRPQQTAPSAWIDTGVPSAPTAQYQDTGVPVTPSVLEGARKHFKDTLKDYHDRGKQNDYYTFIAAKTAMASAIPVESQRYTIAYTSLAAAGLTKETIMQTGQQYIAAIDQELGNFNASFAPSFKEQVEDRKALIQQKQDQMMALSKQIQGLSDEIKQMNDDVISSEGILVGAKNAFERAGKEAKDEIATELSKADQFIQQ